LFGHWWSSLLEWTLFLSFPPLWMGVLFFYKIWQGFLKNCCLENLKLRKNVQKDDSYWEQSFFWDFTTFTQLNKIKLIWTHSKDFFFPIFFFWEKIIIMVQITIFSNFFL
jgi:hypothetical protein